MKNNLLFFAFLSAGLLFLISSTINYQSSSFVFTFMNENPTLPETPFTYGDVHFPEHMSSDSTETGYDGDVDTTILDFVDDDISTLGRVLFYDEKLSALENMSCATCHKQEFSFAEDVALSQGISSLTQRNSMQLNDLGWSNKDGFFWDMEFSALEDMIDIPFKDENEIGANMAEVSIKMLNTDYYPDLFEKAFGDAEITEERIVEALKHFISSMTSFNSRFDQQANKGFVDFTEEENLGKELFQLNCSTCHMEGNLNIFGDVGVPIEELIQIFPFLFNNGLEENPEDLGVGEWMPGFEGLYKLPTMRNIEVTAPYMHDGRFETLDDVIDFYSEDVVQTSWNEFIPPGGFGFDEEEKKALKAFLLTLTDESFLTDVKWSDPFAGPINNKPTEFLNLQVSPNPMMDYALIEVEDNDNSQMEIKIFDNTGKLIKTDSFQGNSYQLNKENMIPGIYNITLSSSSKYSTMKIIVQ